MALRVVPTIVSSCGYTVCLSDKGELYSFGHSLAHAHGHAEDAVFDPKQICGLNNIVGVDCGDEHTACIDSNGNLFLFGDNRNGQLGLELNWSNVIQSVMKVVTLKRRDIKHTHEFQKIDVPKIKQVCCGKYFNVCVSEEGELYSFGDNMYGQLGHGDVKNYFYPRRISSLQNVDYISCGFCSVICKTLNNEIYAWGLNDKGQLGIGNTIDKHIPYKCTEWVEDVVDIQCGFKHTIVLTKQQEVFSCGSNSSLQLGREFETRKILNLGKIEELPPITRICSKGNSTLCIDIENNLYVFGENSHFQLGIESNDSIKPTRHPTLSNIIDFGKGELNTFVKTSNNEIYAFGSDSSLQPAAWWGVNNSKTLPQRVLEGNENIWFSNINLKPAKSARK